MLETYFVEESDIPSFTDKKMLDFASDLRQEMYYYKEATSELRDVIWPACDKAYMCFRDLPAGKMMKWVDNGVLGETDIRDAVNGMTENLLLAMMPPDEIWLTAVSRGQDQPSIIEAVRDYMADLHHKCGTRSQYGKHLTQMMVRGTSHIGCHWEHRVAVRRIGQTQAARRKMKKLFREGGVAPEELKTIDRQRRFVEVYNGPVVYPIDTYRVFLDPTSELGLEACIPSIRLVFKTPEDLENAVDPYTRAPLYDQNALKDLVPFTPAEIYADDPRMFESSRYMGLTPERDLTDGKLIPVYIFHRLERRWEDLCFVDRFIYLARSKSKEGWRIIRMQENPNDYGDKPFFTDTFSDWLNVPYGTGAVEKSLPAWKAKCIIAALSLNAQVASVFPAFSYVSGVLKDDRAPQLGPGQGNLITFRAGVGLNWFAPIPTPKEGAVMSIQDQQLLGAKILSQTGATGSTLFTDPTKTVPQEKTATQVKQETFNASTGRENQVEKFTISSLQPLAQAVYNLSRQEAVGQVHYTKRTPTGGVTNGQIAASQLDRDRDIIIVGRKGALDKAQDVTNLTEALKAMMASNAAQLLPNFLPILQDMLLKLAIKFGIDVTPEMKLSPEELAAMDPKVQMQALQLALQSPEGQQMALQMLMGNGDGGGMPQGAMGEPGQEQMG